MQSAALIALSLMRLRAAELSAWFHVTGKMSNIRKQDEDVQITLFPMWIERNGESCSLPILLALIRLFFGAKLKPKVAATGTVNLKGEIGKVLNIVAKVKAAVIAGAEIILVPLENQGDLDEESFEGTDRVKYVGKVTDAFEKAVEGKYVSYLFSLAY